MLPIFASTGSVANTAATAASGIFLMIFFILLFAIGTVIYFIPSIIAFKRDKPNKIAILALNFFLGWALIGWIVSLVWALANEQTAAPQVIVYNTPPPPFQPSQPPPTQQPQQSSLPQSDSTD